MHWCANAVCGDDGWASAVLIRALHPVAGIEAMRARRPAARADRDLTNGPAKLCQALGVERSFDGADLVTGDRGIAVVDDGTPPPDEPGQSTRIGLSAGAEHPWRWYVPGDPYVSRREPVVRS
jgi:DNA-3-methyladenine glycosylase